MSDPIWKPVTTYEGFYEVSDQGEVRALFDSHNGLKSGRLLKLNRQSTGYLTVTLCRPGRSPWRMPLPCYVHRLVLSAFVSPPKKNQAARHLDGNKGNNNLSNLQWGTYSENEKDKERHGTKVEGERHWKSKLNESAVRLIREYGKTGATFKEIGSHFGISTSAAFSAIKRRTWKHVV